MDKIEHLNTFAPYMALYAESLMEGRIVTEAPPLELEITGSFSQHTRMSEPELTWVVTWVERDTWGEVEIRFRFEAKILELAVDKALAHAHEARTLISQ